MAIRPVQLIVLGVSSPDETGGSSIILPRRAGGDSSDGAAT
jgi:hypothetical protein